MHQGSEDARMDSCLALAGPIFTSVPPVQGQTDAQKSQQAAKDVVTSLKCNLRTKKKSTLVKCKKAGVDMKEVQKRLDGWGAKEIAQGVARAEYLYLTGVL